MENNKPKQVWFKDRPNYQRHLTYGLLKLITGKSQQQIYRELKNKWFNILEQEDVHEYIKSYYKSKYL